MSKHPGDEEHKSGSESARHSQLPVAREGNRGGETVDSGYLHLYYFTHGQACIIHVFLAYPNSPCNTLRECAHSQPLLTATLDQLGLSEHLQSFHLISSGIRASKLSVIGPKL